MTNDVRVCVPCRRDIFVKRDRHLVLRRDRDDRDRYFCCEECFNTYFESFKTSLRFLFDERIVKVVVP